jgi:thiol:disulfide interchange protein DsbC
MLLLVCTFFAAHVALVAGTGWTAPKPAEEQLAREEAAYLLAPVFKSKRFTVLNVSRSPVSGLWEVLLETDAGKTILYVDSSKRYFMGGPVLTLQGMKNMTEESLVSAASSRVDPSAVPLEDALVVGNPKAPKRVVVFMSPTCKPCREMLQTIKTLSQKRDDMAFYLKMKPEGPTGESFWRSETIVLTRSLELLEESLEGLKIPKPGRPAPQVTQTMALAERLGIHATPTTMLADGTLVEGALSAENLLGWMERHLSEAGTGKAEVGKK